MNANTREQVIVVGAGIGGLATAIALHRAGIETTVVERAGELSEIGAAIGVQTNAVRALRELGVADRLLEIGVPIEYYEYATMRGRRLTRWSQGAIGRKLGEPTVVVHRADLQRVLLAAVPDGTIRLRSTCTSFDTDTDTGTDSAGVTVRLGDGDELRGRLLVGADGFGSVIRRRLIGDEPRYSGWSAYRGITRFADARFPVGIARQFLGAGRSFGMWHIADGRVYWVATIRQPAGSTADDAAGGRKAYVLDRFARAAGLVTELVEGTDEAAILRNEVYDRVPAGSWNSERVVLLGDAAHPTTPVTGQGGGQAIIDAAVLGDELRQAARGDGTGRAGLADTTRVRRALQAYEDRRRPVTTSITNEAWRISMLHHLTNPIAVAGRDLSLRLTPTRVWNRRMEQRLAF